MSEKFTVGELREALSGIPDDHFLHFEGGITFSRLKRWDENEWVVIFQQLQASLSDETRKRIQVAFARTSDSADSAETVLVPHL